MVIGYLSSDSSSPVSVSCIFPTIIVLIELYLKDTPYSSTNSRVGAEEFKVTPEEVVAVVA